MRSDWVARLLSAISYLPLPLLHGIGAAIGWLFYLIPNRHRHIAKCNIALCFPELGPHRQNVLLRQNLMETGKTLFEAPLLWFGNDARVMGLVREVRGGEKLADAIEQGVGIIGVTPHLGSWEMMSLYYSTRSPVTSLYRPPRYQVMDRILRETRGRMGATLVPTNAGGLKTLMRTLRAGGTIGLLPDQDPRNSGGVFAPFFGIAANTITLLPRLVGKSEAIAVIGFAERLPWGQGYRIHFDTLPATVADRDPAVATVALNEGVEKMVKLAPAQYQWIYKRFRTRPEGEPPLY